MPKKELLRILFHVAMAFALVAPIFVHPFGYPDNYDFRYFIAWIEAGRRSLLWYGDFPLWNPWTCGGQVYLANPQSTIAAPTFLLPLLFGSALGTKLMLVAYLFFALDGMYRLARDMKLDVDSALIASIIFGGSGWMGLHLSSGHLNFAGAALLPYLMLCHRRSLDEWEWLIPLGAQMAWIVGLGGTSTPAMATVFLGLSALIETIRRRNARAVLTLMAAAIVAVVVGGARLLPVFEFVNDHPRPMFETDHNGLLFLLGNAFPWRGLQSVSGKRYWFHEYGWKLPYLVWPFLLIGLRWMKARWELWLIFVFGLAIAAGSALPFGPWWLMKNLPLFKDLRVPSRYILFTVFATSLLVASSIQMLFAEKPWRRAAMWGLGAIFAIEVIAFNAWLFKGTFNRTMASGQSSAPFFQVTSHWRQMFDEIMLNHGVIGCDEESPLQRANQLDLGDVPQARLEDQSLGTVTITRFSPSKIALHVALSAEALVLVNTNWNEHWSTSVGQIVKFGDKHPRDRDGGRLGVRVPAGTHDVLVSYRPRSFLIGLLLTGIGGSALLIVFVLQRVRRRRISL